MEREEYEKNIRHTPPARPLEQFWGHPQAILEHLGTMLGRLRRPLGTLEQRQSLLLIFKYPGVVLAPSWALFGHLGAISGRLGWPFGTLDTKNTYFARFAAGTILGQSWGHLGAMSGRLGYPLGMTERFCFAPEQKQMRGWHPGHKKNKNLSRKVGPSWGHPGAILGP